MAANRENLSRPSLEIFRLCVQPVCPMFNVSSLKESQFQALYSLRFKAVFVGPEQNPKILQDVKRGNFAFFLPVTEAALTTERSRNMLESKNSSGEFDQRGCG